MRQLVTTNKVKNVSKDKVYTKADVNQLLEDGYLTIEPMVYEDFLPVLFYKLEYSFGFRYKERDKEYYKPEPTDIMLFYAIQYHTLENNSRFMYNKNWWSDLFSWYDALHNTKYVIPKRIKFSTLEKRMKQYRKLNEKYFENTKK